MVTAESVLKMCRPYDNLIFNGLYSFYHTTLFESDTVIVRFSMFNKTLILNGDSSWKNYTDERINPARTIQIIE